MERLKDIANGILDGIVMEEDLPSKDEDEKLPILDMACWLDDQGLARHIHYEKAVSSKELIPERSAHSNSCKRSVAISEIVRRCMNTSRGLDWDTYFVPCLDNYMARLKKAGYPQGFRKSVLTQALNIYESKVKASDEGCEPLNRGNAYKKVERMKAKRVKKKNWNKKGGYGAPIIIPSTPNSELAKMLREIADQEKDKKLRFKIVEKGGMTIGRSLMRPNPIGSGKCGKEDCHPCKSGGMNCHKNEVCYGFDCDTCKAMEINANYYGESCRNLYTRAGEHTKKAEKGDVNSFIQKHQAEFHNSEPANFSSKVIKSFQENH